MLYIIDTMPEYCPDCGCPTNRINPREFFNSVSMVCDCGARFTFAPTEELLKLGDFLNSDIRLWHERNL